MKQNYLGDFVFLLSKELKRSLDEKLENENIGFAQVQTLMMLKILEQEDDLNVDRLARELNLNKSNVSRNISKLEETGFIVVECDRSDNRKKTISISKSANTEIEGFKKTLTEVSEKMLKGIDQEKVDITMECLNQAIMNLRGESII